MATDVTVTITPPPSVSTTVTPPASKSVTLTSSASVPFVTGISGYLQGQIDGFSSPNNAVLITGDQNISGVKNFYSRPTVNGTGVLLSGEAATAATGYLTGYVQVGQTGAFLTTGAGDLRYVGLTGNQTISGQKTFANYTDFQSGVGFSGKLNFNTLNQSDLLDGQADWSADYGTLAIGMNNGEVVNPLGFKNFYRVKANQNITKGRVVMAVGTVGNSDFILAQEAANIGPSGELIMGVAAEDISAGNFGDVVSFGAVKGVDTSLFNSGAILYYDATSTGGFTQVAPQAPNAKVITALNLHPANNGTVFVRVSAGSVLGGTDSNVQFSALKDRDFISYNSGSGIWFNKTLTTGDVSGASNFALSSETGSFATTGYVTGVSGHLQNQIATLADQTGDYAFKSQTGAFLTTGAGDLRYINATGDTVQGNLSVVNSLIIGSSNSSHKTSNIIAGENNYNSGLNSIIGGTQNNNYNLDNIILLGYANEALSGEYVPPNDPDNPIQMDPSKYGFVLGNACLLSHSGAGIISATDPSQPINERLFSSGVGTLLLRGEYGIYLRGQTEFDNRPTFNGTGFLLSGEGGVTPNTGALTGVFYPLNSNPSGYITGVDLSPYVTGQVVRPSETGTYTGQFYPLNVNPSGYLTSASLAGYATESYVTGASGHLQSQINTTNSSTGAFLTTGAANSLYYSLANGQSVSGYAITGYNDAITGASVTGDTTKTLTLFQRDGTTVSTTFTDNAGSGSSGGAGNWSLMDSRTISNNSAIDFVLSGTYTRYMIVFENVHLAADGYVLSLRTSNNSGASFASGASDYHYGRGDMAGIYLILTQGIANRADLITLVGSGIDEGAYGEVVFYDPRNSGLKTTWKGSLGRSNWNSNDMFINPFVGRRDNFEETNAIRIYSDSGFNLYGGKLKLYGWNE